MDTNALIEAVKSYPSLYIKDQSSNTNIEQKNMIWHEISLKVNQPTEKCKAKWRNLRDSYQKAIKWKRELEQLGKLSNYHEYKHESALEFLELNPKRKSSRDSERSKTSKRTKLELHETSVYSVESQDDYTAAVEYLIETDPNESQQLENDDDVEEETSLNTISREYVVHEMRDEEKIENIHDIKENSEEANDQTFLNYDDAAANNETASPQHLEIPYQESFANDSRSENSIELDSWLSGIKETIMVRLENISFVLNLLTDFSVFSKAAEGSG